MWATPHGRREGQPSGWCVVVGRGDHQEWARDPCGCRPCSPPQGLTVLCHLEHLLLVTHMNLSENLLCGLPPALAMMRCLEVSPPLLLLFAAEIPGRAPPLRDPPPNLAPAETQPAPGRRLFTPVLPILPRFKR